MRLEKLAKSSFLNLLFAGNLDKGLAMAFVSSMLAHSTFLKPKPTHRLSPAGGLAVHYPCAVAAVSYTTRLQSRLLSSTRKVPWLQFLNQLTNISVPSFAKICNDSSDPGVRGPEK